MATVVRLVVILVLGVVIARFVLQKRAKEPTEPTDNGSVALKDNGEGDLPPAPPPPTTPAYIDPDLAGKGVPAPGKP